MQNESTIGSGVAEAEQALFGEFGSQLSGVLKLLIVIAFAWLAAYIIEKMDAVRKIAPRFSHKRNQSESDNGGRSKRRYKVSPNQIRLHR